MTFGAAGGAKDNVVKTPGTPSAMPGRVGVYINDMTGKIKSGAVLKATALDNKATSIGFPWTTGALTISQPAALATPGSLSPGRFVSSSLELVRCDW